MTQEAKTELDYLLDIVLEASKWKIEDGQDSIRLEVESRINSILSHEGTVVSRQPEISPILTADDFNALEAARLNEHLASPEQAERKLGKYKETHVRCSENGKLVWRPKEHCTQEPRDNSKGGPKWQWVYHDPNKVKQEQEEQMWAVHEQGDE